MSDALLGDDRSVVGIGPPPPRPSRPPMEVDRVDVRLTSDARVEPPVWERRVANLIALESPADEDDLRSALRELDLRDEAGGHWRYDGSEWRRWDGAAWVPARPTSPVALARVELEHAVPRLPPAAQQAVATPAAAPVTTPAAAHTRAYVPTHVAPPGGLPVWNTPDPATAPVAAAEEGIDLMLLETRADGWARVMFSNSWIGWLDGRLLVPRP